MQPVVTRTRTSPSLRGDTKGSIPIAVINLKDVVEGDPITLQDISNSYQTAGSKESSSSSKRISSVSTRKVPTAVIKIPPCGASKSFIERKSLCILSPNSIKQSLWKNPTPEKLPSDPEFDVKQKSYLNQTEQHYNCFARKESFSPTSQMSQSRKSVSKSRDPDQDKTKKNLNKTFDPTSDSSINGSISCQKVT